MYIAMYLSTVAIHLLLANSGHHMVLQAAMKPLKKLATVCSQSHGSYMLVRAVTEEGS